MQIKKLESMDHLFDEKTDGLTKFLAGPYSNAIHYCRIALVIVFFVLGVVAVAIASRMGPLTKGEEMMSADHPLVET